MLVINENLAEKLKVELKIGLGSGWALQKNSNVMFDWLLVGFEMITEES